MDVISIPCEASDGQLHRPDDEKGVAVDFGANMAFSIIVQITRNRNKYWLNIVES